ncbi:MAG TPA: DUF5359 family protein [Bacillaceae bacterium]
MKRIERVIIKLAFIQFVVLVGVQGFFLDTELYSFLNRMTLYEGVMEEEEQPDYRVDTDPHED